MAEPSDGEAREAIYSRVDGLSCRTHARQAVESAGRDQQQAHCVLPYTKDDVERQFGMSAGSRLTRREIHGVLKALRRLSRRNKSDEVQAAIGEILVKDEDNDFRRDSGTDDTRGRTALAWLEESDLLSREEIAFGSSRRRCE